MNRNIGVVGRAGKHLGGVLLSVDRDTLYFFLEHLTFELIYTPTRLLLCPPVQISLRGKAERENKSIDLERNEYY